MIDSELYILTRRAKYIWQRDRRVCLVVAYYDDDSEQWKAKAEMKRRARTAQSLMQLPIETRIHKRINHE